MSNYTSYLPFSLTPVEVCPSAFSTLFHLVADKEEEILSKLLLDRFGVRDVFFCGSGKEAIFNLLSAIKERNQNKPHILISSYTCPDIAAAIIRAGFKIALVDFLPNSLNLDLKSIPVDLSSVSAVILSNLYGLIDQIKPWLELADKNNFFVIDDACQGLFSKEDGSSLGLRGHFGIYSFARGKCLSGISAGALSINSKLENDKEFFKKAIQARQKPLDSTAISQLKDFLYTLSINIFSQPNFYCLIRNLPFLRIGESRYNQNFLKKAPTSFALANTRLNLLRFNSLRDKAREVSLNWKELLAGIDLIDLFSKEMQKDSSIEIVPLRYPVLLQKREEVYNQLSNCGISLSYPCLINQYPGLESCVVGDSSNAKNIVNRIITLPVHGRVDRNVQKIVVKKLKNTLC